MRYLVIIIFLLCARETVAQEERDSVLTRCPVFITDTVTANNFFIAARPCTVKVYRLRGNLTIVIEQRDQFLTIVFDDRKLKSQKYRIKAFPDKNEVSVKYSFRSGDQVSYVEVANGTVETSFDAEKQLWNLRVNGMIANLVDRNVSYYRVRADFHIR